MASQSDKEAYNTFSTARLQYKAKQLASGLEINIVYDTVIYMAAPIPPNQKAAAGADPLEYRLQIKEQWLREEIRAARALAFGVMQGGTTVLAAVTSFLYFIRRDITQHLLPTGSRGRCFVEF